MTICGGRRLDDRKISAIKIAAAYALIASCWVVVSDRILLAFTADADRVLFLEGIYETLFVVVSAVILGIVLWRHNASLAVKKNELEFANRELQTFNHTVSHELRSPLTIVKGYAEILFKRYGRRLDGDFQMYVNSISNQAKRMDQLVQTILNFSSLSHASLAMTQVDLSSLANEILLRLKSEYPDRVVVIDVQPGLKTEGDEKLLEVVLENLLRNAWKYTSRQIEGKIEFGLNEKKGESRFFVRDNGVGFDMEDSQKLFAPFQRLHDRDEFEGFGVGLATVNRIIDLHGGRIWAEAEVGKGATFFFIV